MILFILISVLSPGVLWLDALSSSHWSEEYDLGLSANSAAVSHSGNLPDPVFQFSIAGAPIETRNGAVLGSFGFQQKVPWPGFLSSSRNFSERSLDLAQVRIDLQEFKKRTEITNMWVEVYRTSQRKIILEETSVLLNSLILSATGASSALFTDQSALADLRVRVTLAELKPVLEERLQTASLVRLEALIGGEIAGISVIPTVDWFSERIETAVVNPPSVIVANAAVAAAEANLMSVKSNRMPDFFIGGSYSVIGSPEISAGAVSPGDDSWMISAGLTLPLGYSGDKALVEEAEFILAQSRAHLLQVQDEVNAELLTYRIIIENSVEELVLLEEMLPLSDAAVLSASRIWVTGRGSYSSLISALQNNLTINMTIIEKEAQLINTTARWLELAGAVTNEGEFL